jgi:uncharacterized protein YukE
MNQPIEVKPDGLRNAANDFDDLAEKTRQLLETLRSSTGSEGDAWGDDKAGHKWADGDKGYIKNRDNTFDSLSQVADVFAENAKNLRDSATLYEQNEQEAASGSGQSQQVEMQAVQPGNMIAEQPAGDGGEQWFRRVRSDQVATQAGESQNVHVRGRRGDGGEQLFRRVQSDQVATQAGESQNVHVRGRRGDGGEQWFRRVQSDQVATQAGESQNVHVRGQRGDDGQRLFRKLEPEQAATRSISSESPVNAVSEPDTAPTEPGSTTRFPRMDTPASDSAVTEQQRYAPSPRMEIPAQDI